MFHTISIQVNEDDNNDIGTDPNWFPSDMTETNENVFMLNILEPKYIYTL